MRITLPNDGWAELLDPEDITRKQIRQVKLAFAKGAVIGEQLEFGREAILTAIVTNWTLEQPIPSKADNPLDVLCSLSRPVWYALEKAADDYLPNFGAPKEGDPVVDPPTPSDG